MTDSTDKARIRCAFDRAAPGFAKADFLHSEIRGRLLSRLSVVTIEPEWILDLGAGTGAGARQLADSFPHSRVMALDMSIGMLTEARSGTADRPAASDNAAICADAEHLPLHDDSIDMIFSNLLLQHCPDPFAVLAEARRVLRYPGVIAFTTCGPDSLRELREAWAGADRFSHIASFIDMHDLGDALVQAGFAEPVMFRETIRVTYPSLSRALSDLRGGGSINATGDRNRGLTGRDAWQRLTDEYEQFRDADGHLPVTIEVVYGLAWAGQQHHDGEFEIPVEALRRFARE